MDALLKSEADDCEEVSVSFADLVSFSIGPRCTQQQSNLALICPTEGARIGRLLDDNAATMLL